MEGPIAFCWAAKAVHYAFLEKYVDQCKCFLLRFKVLIRSDVLRGVVLILNRSNVKSFVKPVLYRDLW